MTPANITEGRRLAQAVRDADSSTMGWAQEMLRQWAGAHVSELLDAAEATVPGLVQYNAAIASAEKAESKLNEMRSVIVEIAKQRGCDADELIANPSLVSPYEGEDDPLVVSLLAKVACAERQRDEAAIAIDGLIERKCKAERQRDHTIDELMRADDLVVKRTGERDAVLAVLVEVEWCQRVVMHESRFCPWCGHNSEHPHTADCALDQALRLLRDAANRLDVLKTRHIMLQRIETLMGELEEWSEDSEEDLHDAIIRTLDERSARATKAEAALSRARAKVEFAQVVELERDHAQLVEVPDALQRAQKAEQQLKKVGLAIASFGDTFAATRIELEALITELERMTPSSTEGS